MKCVLHIGTEKTGTTLLQRWLYENRDALSAEGVALSGVMDHPNNRKFVSYVHGGVDDYLSSKSIFNKDERAAFFEGYDETLADEFAALSATHHTLLITSEHFHSRLFFPEQVRRVQTTLAPYFEAFRVICYFREQSRKRTSLYSTALKSGGNATLEAFHHDRTPKHHQYNYMLSFGKWEDAFGLDALVPRIYDRAYLEEGDIRRDFLKHALPEVDPDALSYTTESTNTALSEDEARLFQAANAARSSRIGRVQDHVPGAMKHVVAHLPGLDRTQPIKDPRQQQMYEDFHESNVEFFQRYFGYDGNLFEPPGSAADAEDEQPKYTLSDMVDLVERVTSVKNFVFVTDGDVALLQSLADRLHASGQISAAEAVALLSIAQRVRREAETVTEQIETLWSQQ